MAVTAQGRGRTGGRSEPRGGWRLGVKTSAPTGSGPVEELAPDEAARQEAADALEAKRRSDRMARKDVSDLALDEHHVAEGRSAFRTRSQGNEPRTPFGGDPAEERRIAAGAARGESPSVWAQDTRAPQYRESWDEQQAARLQNEGEAAERELRKAVRGGLSELVRVRNVVLTDALTPSAAELERLEGRPRLDDDGRRANRRDRAQVVADGLPLAPPLGASLAHAEVDPALVALAAGKYPGAELEPSVKPEWLAGPGHADTAAEAPEVIERALDDVEKAYFERWRDEPGRAADLEHRWEREREALRDRASACPAPEETRLLVEGMREYSAELAQAGRGMCYGARLHTAVGQDPASSRLPADVLGEALDRYPDIVEGIRAVDPDSPLCVVPSGVDQAAYGRVVAGALDAARAPVAAAVREGVSLDPAVVRARVMADVAGGVADLERGPDRGEQARGGPSSAELVASLREREQKDRVDRAGERFRDLSDALASRGVFFEVGDDPGALRQVDSGDFVQVSADAFEPVAERGPDGEVFSGPAPAGSPDAQREAVADAMRGAGDALWQRVPHVPDGASERFGERMAARVFEEPLPVPQEVSPEAEEAAARLASDVSAEAAALEHKRAERVEVRDNAVERFERVLDALDGRVEVSVRDFMADGDEWVGYAVRRDPDSGQVSGQVVIDPRLRHGDRSFTNDQLAERHGQAYVDLGRALGEGDSGRNEDWSKVYGVLAAGAKDGGPVTVGVDSCASNSREHAALGKARAYGSALREQVRADGFATEQMKRAWPRAWREETPRVVERADGGVRVPEARIPGLGPPRRVMQVLERDGKQLAKDIGRSVGEAEKLVRRAARGPLPPRGAETPPRAPAPAAGAVQAQERFQGPRSEHDVLDAKLSVAR